MPRKPAPPLPEGVWEVEPPWWRWPLALSQSAYVVVATGAGAGTLWLVASQGVAIPFSAVAAGFVAAFVVACFLWLVWRPFERKWLLPRLDARAIGKVRAAAAAGAAQPALRSLVVAASLTTPRKPLAVRMLRYEALGRCAAVADLELPRVVIVGRKLLPREAVEAEGEFREPEDVSELETKAATTPVGLAFAGILFGGLFLWFGVTRFGSGPPALAGLVIGSAVVIPNTIALLARWRVNPFQMSSLHVAPGRIAVTRRAGVREWTWRGGVLFAARDEGAFRVRLAVPGDPESITLHFRSRNDPRWRRVLELWLAPGEPAPPVFET